MSARVGIANDYGYGLAVIVSNGEVKLYARSIRAYD